MPSANIYFEREEIGQKIRPLLAELREFLAHRLSCSDRDLTVEEISLRVLKCEQAAMIAPLEINITAHAYLARVRDQDDICHDVVRFLKKKNESLAQTHVWLQLCELGHSWKE